jgi:putative membrane protein
MNRRGVEVLWLFILGAFDVVTGMLLFSGKISLYLARRMFPVAWFGFAMLSLLFVFHLVQLVRAQKSDFGKRTRLYGLVFLIPLLLFSTSMPTEDTAMTLNNPNMQIVGKAQTETQMPAPEPTEKIAEQTSETPLTSSEKTQTPQPTPEATTTPEVVIADVAAMKPCVLADEAGETPSDIFSDYVYTPIEELQGQRISLYGFVYKDDAFPEGTLLVSRLLMTCCAADTSLVGFHVRVEDADAFENDEWIQVTGTVSAFQIDYEGKTYTMPILADGEIVHRDAPPDDPYIYPI